MTASVTIFCTGAYLLLLQFNKSSCNFTLLNLRLDLGLVISLCDGFSDNILYRHFNQLVQPWGRPAALLEVLDSASRMGDPSRCPWTAQRSVRWRSHQRWSRDWSPPSNFQSSRTFVRREWMQASFTSSHWVIFSVWTTLPSWPTTWTSLTHL